jgi:hypothetical protein
MFVPCISLFTRHNLETSVEETNHEERGNGRAIKWGAEEVDNKNMDFNKE